MNVKSIRGTIKVFETNRALSANEADAEMSKIREEYNAMGMRAGFIETIVGDANTVIIYRVFKQ